MEAGALSAINVLSLDRRGFAGFLSWHKAAAWGKSRGQRIAPMTALTLR
jgi:hypothetical protein